MSNNARQVIKDNLIPALTSLGGTASTDDIKAEILRMTNTVAEDYGRTKPNKKYPEGRLSFVEKFTLVSVEMKRKGMVFTPAYAHLSLDQNAVVAGKKKPTKIAENHKSSKVKAQSAPVESEEATAEEMIVETVEVETVESAPVVEETTTEEMIAEAVEIVEQVESEEAPIEPDHVLIDDSNDVDEDREYIEPTGRLIEAWLDRDNAMKCGYDENGRIWEVALTDEEMSRYNVSDSEEAPVEDDQAILEADYNEGIGYADNTGEGSVADHILSGGSVDEYTLESSESDDDVVVASTFAEGEVISAGVEYSEEMSDDSSMAEELLAEEIVEAEAEAESEDNGISVSYDLGDIFDDEEEENEGLNLLLEKINGHNLYGKIEGNEVYLSMYEDGRVTLKFEESIPSLEKLHSNPEKADKLRNKLQTLKGDLEGYATLITRTKEARISRLNHSISSNLGCFGDEEWTGVICETCALKKYCQSTETITQ